MLVALLLGGFIIVLNVVIQAYGNLIWLKRVTPTFQDNGKSYHTKKAWRLLIVSFLFFTALHTLQTLIWALAYVQLPHTSGIFQNFTEAWYYSLVTFTTLGYGDITLVGDWRILSGIEAINGIMLIGWTTAMMYSLTQQILKSLPKKPV
ncbi:potassium channel family protein [Bizionia sediminis]|uniref:Potassium channel family protein n=1 Tax=Bizionia sediminis TaxID=1737064 RepID=A0ABW5KSG5_9FLAO